MAWTYTPDFTTARDQIRLLIGDTNTNDQQLQDAEIAYLVTENGGVYSAAAAAARTIAAKYARMVDLEVRGLQKQSLAQRQQHYADLAGQLTQKSARAGAMPYAGGISVADKQTQEQDTDRVKPYFTADLQQAPGTTQDRSGTALY